jgi:hypothetical protein
MNMEKSDGSAWCAESSDYQKLFFNDHFNPPAVTLSAHAKDSPAARPQTVEWRSKESGCAVLLEVKQQLDGELQDYIIVRPSTESIASHGYAEFKTACSSKYSDENQTMDWFKISIRDEGLLRCHQCSDIVPARYDYQCVSCHRTLHPGCAVTLQKGNNVLACIDCINQQNQTVPLSVIEGIPPHRLLLSDEKYPALYATVLPSCHGIDTNSIRCVPNLAKLGNNGASYKTKAVYLSSEFEHCNLLVDPSKCEDYTDRLRSEPIAKLDIAHCKECVNNTLLSYYPSLTSRKWKLGILVCEVCNRKRCLNNTNQPLAFGGLSDLNVLFYNCDDSSDDRSPADEKVSLYYLML